MKKAFGFLLYRNQRHFWYFWRQKYIKVLFHKIGNCKEYRKLHKAKTKDYKLKLWLFVLVAELVHTNISAKRPCHAPGQQSAFRYAHFAFFCLVFVHAEHYKGDDVYDYKAP